MDPSVGHCSKRTSNRQQVETTSSVIGDESVGNRSKLDVLSD